MVGGIQSCRGWRRAAVAIAAGAISALSFAPYFAAPVLFVTLPVFVWLIDAADSRRQAAMVGWLFGFGYFFANLFWVGEAFLVEADKFAMLLPFAITLLPAGLALFWAMAAAAAKAVWRPGPSRVIAFALALTASEWLRGHLFTGFPWNLLGYALTWPDALMQTSAVVGVYGLTLIAAVIFSVPLVALAAADASKSIARAVAESTALALLPLLVMLGFGSLRLTEPSEMQPGVRMRIVQPSIDQRQKWMPEHQRRIFDEHLELSRTSPDGRRDDLAGISHVIWPEAAMPFLPLEQPVALAAIADLLPDGTVLITGALRREPAEPDAAPLSVAADRMFNGVLVLDSNGQVKGRYDKIHLVPFGEYLPFETVFGALGLKKLTHGRGSFSAGVEPRALMTIPGMPDALALVCYESLFPRDIVQGAERPAIIINVTNDGWFGKSSGPHQHFHHARVRAVEEGVPLIRAANNGISAVVDRFGRVEQFLPINAVGVIDSPVPAPAPKAATLTPYARFGDWIVVALFLALAAGYWRTRQRKLTLG